MFAKKNAYDSKGLLSDKSKSSRTPFDGFAVTWEKVTGLSVHTVVYARVLEERVIIPAKNDTCISGFDKIPQRAYQLIDKHRKL